MTTNTITVLNALPTPGERDQRSNRRYITKEVVETAKTNPGGFVPLNDGKLVDKAYLPVLEGQASKIGGVRIEWVFMKDRKTPGKKPGTTSYAQMGQAFLTCDAGAELKASKKAKKAKRAHEEQSMS